MCRERMRNTDTHTHTHTQTWDVGGWAQRDMHQGRHHKRTGRDKDRWTEEWTVPGIRGRDQAEGQKEGQS